ncbi:helix-turn-helix domain-containing protein [Dactylosporangium roseum]|uniref:Helix-turn-helix domain-containing protein n=1 Tax=Dactylosporangium roseum TaxID=47989 RepID=A0ABY5YXV1_9ACTN|nr:helix-turn-helix domain-containing protein [Dactylosporangium roseum]UWZ34580.1 helix-turn-helix domain-containing protein [Dactylosporangium roseum]
MQDRWTSLTALTDPSRRALYDYVRRQDHPVSREEAADVQRMSRGLAAFHLDKLVDAGLLRARYEAPADQPRGRGRAPKVYEAAGDGLAITVPERRYELIAEILADAVADDPAHAAEAARRYAHARGEAIGAQLRAERVDIASVLAGLGFEPQLAQDGRILLHNCPFHALAARHTTLVCGLNHTLIAGLVEGLGIADLQARLVPRPGACCVELAAPPPSDRQ